MAEHNGITFDEDLNGVPIKSFELILQETLDDWKAEKPGMDIQKGSDAHIRASAVAQHIYALYVSGAVAVNQYMPDTATGVYLRTHVKEEGIEAKLATKAKGLQLQYRRDPNLTRTDIEAPVASGIKVVTRDGVIFESTEAVTLAPNVLEATVPYQAVDAGDSGNIQPGDIIGFYGQPPAGINFVTNLDATADGSNDEDDETLRGRYFEATGQEEWHGSPAWMEAEALKVPGITSASAIKNARGEGTMDVLVTSGWAIPSQAKLDEVYNYLSDPSREPINVDLQVIAPEPITINLRVANAGLSQTVVEEAFQEYLVTVKPKEQINGTATVYPLHIATALVNKGAVNPVIEEPAAPIALTARQMPLPGVVTLV